MKGSKPQQPPANPNSDLFEAAAISARLELARHEALSSATAEVVSVHYPTWKITLIDKSLTEARFTFIAPWGESGTRPFTAETIEDLVYWLEDAEWLTALGLQEPRDSLGKDLLAFLRQFGFLGRPAFAESTPPDHWYYVPELIAALASLRQAWLFASTMQSNDTEKLHEAFARIVELRQLSGEEAEMPAPEDLVRAARDWVRGALLNFGLSVSWNPGQPLAPLKPVAAPANPLQALMLSLAISAGAVQSDAPAVYRCDYPPCGRIFVRAKKNTRGANTFCSDRCGKRHSATVHVYRARQSQREARERSE